MTEPIGLPNGCVFGNATKSNDPWVEEVFSTQVKSTHRGVDSIMCDTWVEKNTTFVISVLNRSFFSYSLKCMKNKTIDLYEFSLHFRKTKKVEKT